MGDFVEEVELFDRNGVDLRVRVWLVGVVAHGDEVGCVPCSEPGWSRLEIMKEVIV